MLSIINNVGETIATYNTNNYDIVNELAERVNDMTDFAVVPEHDYPEWELDIIEELHEDGYFVTVNSDTIIVSCATRPNDRPFIFENWSQVECWMEDAE